MQVLHVHYYKQFFPGPGTPGSTQPRALVRALADAGHVVTVISGDLNGASDSTEVDEKYNSPNGGSFTVRRLRTPGGHRQSLARRLATYATFMVRADLAGRKLRRPDVVIGSIQPLFAGLAARDIARKCGVPFLLEIRDLWPDALEVKGAVPGWQLKPLYRAADHLYAAADRIVSVTPGIRDELVRKGIDAPIDVFPNGFLRSMAELDPGERESVRAQMGWGDDFVAVYTGTHTEVTAIDVIVGAGAALKNDIGIRIDLFGSGQTRDAAISEAERLGLTNVHFHDPVPADAIPGILDAADVTLMALFESPLIHIYFQNKFTTYMGMGKPIIAAMTGQQADIITREDLGRVAATGDEVGMAKYIREASEDFSAYDAMGERARRFVAEHLTLDGILDRYVGVVEQVAYGRADATEGWDPFA